MVRSLVLFAILGALAAPSLAAPANCKAPAAETSAAPVDTLPAEPTETAPSAILADSAEIPTHAPTNDADAPGPTESAAEYSAGDKRPAGKLLADSQSGDYSFDWENFKWGDFPVQDGSDSQQSSQQDDSNPPPQNVNDANSPQGESSAPADPTGGVPADDPEAVALLEAHNVWRRRFGVPDIAWSQELSAKAVEQVSHCKWKHQFNSGDPNYTSEYIDNLATSWVQGMSYGPLSDYVEMWATEWVKYDFEGHQWKKGTGHFPPIVWRPGVAVGCGWKECDSIEGQAQGGRYMTCQYDTGGPYYTDPDTLKANVPPLPANSDEFPRPKPGW